MVKGIWRQRLSNYGCGALAGLVALALRGGGAAGYARSYEHGLQLLPAFTPGAFLAAVLAIDFIYYWQHRLEHRLPLLWAVHAVHHQSELCDTSVSLRVPMLAGVLVALFHLPLALLGLHPVTYLAAYGLHAAVVFLWHSRTPAWLDRAGWVLNSPFIHRLHHASNPELHDRNFAGVLVVWDRLFGTFAKRFVAPLRFGVAEGPSPLSPLRANLEPWRALLRAQRKRWSTGH